MKICFDCEIGAHEMCFFNRKEICMCKCKKSEEWYHNKKKWEKQKEKEDE